MKRLNIHYIQERAFKINNDFINTKEINQKFATNTKLDLEEVDLFTPYLSILIKHEIKF